MAARWLCVCVCALLLLVTTSAFSLTDPPGTFQGITTEDCYWKCGTYGEFMECAFDEVVVGSCGSQSWANCENNVYCPGQSKIYAAIQCCKAKVNFTVEE